ncbi:MAG: hypothetical protein NT161_03685 [Candidatus Nomurabacteria bacterium]|nr:hypothetical protein [Candidatus Nomurabacteria bacterium]
MPSDKLIKKEIEKPRKELVDFRKEITGYINGYKSGRITGTMYDLSLIENVDELIGEDLDMWKKLENYKTNPISERDLDIYQNHVKTSKSLSRDNFRAYIIQKITAFSSLDMNTEEKRKL